MQEILRQAALHADKEALREDYVPTYQFIIQGNYVSNSGTIHGDVNQQQESAPSQNWELAVVEDTSMRVQRFFSEGSLHALSALLTLASLRVVPVSGFHEATELLCSKLASVRHEDAQDLSDRFLTAE